MDSSISRCILRSRRAIDSQGFALVLQCSSAPQPDALRRTEPVHFHAVQADRSVSRRMQVKNQICTEGSSSDDPEQDDSQKKTSCFSNIKIFLVSECALMLAQGTVGAYLVSCWSHPSGLVCQRSALQTRRRQMRGFSRCGWSSIYSDSSRIIPSTSNHENAEHWLIDELLRNVHQAFAPSARHTARHSGRELHVLGENFKRTYWRCVGEQHTTHWSGLQPAEGLCYTLTTWHREPLTPEDTGLGDDVIITTVCAVSSETTFKGRFG